MQLSKAKNLTTESTHFPDATLFSDISALNIFSVGDTTEVLNAKG